MATYQKEVTLETQGNTDVIPIGDMADAAVGESGVSDGVLSLFVAHSTCALTAMEFEPGAVEDLTGLIERLAPRRGDYEHNRRNHDTNGHAHLAAALLGPALAIPVEGGKLRLGTWQTPVLIDFDDRPRRRVLTLTVTGA